RRRLHLLRPGRRQPALPGPVQRRPLRRRARQHPDRQPRQLPAHRRRPRRLGRRPQRQRSFVTDAHPNSIHPTQPDKGRIHSGRVTDPTKVTGQNYRIDIAGTAPAQTYTVTNTDTGAGVANGSYTSGQSIEFDGISVAVAGSPADGDNFSVAPATNSLKL